MGGGCLEALGIVIEVFDSTRPLQAMLDGRGGVSHGRLAGSTIVVCFRCRCLDRSAGLGSGDGLGREKVR